MTRKTQKSYVNAECLGSTKGDVCTYICNMNGRWLGSKSVRVALEETRVESASYDRVRPTRIHEYVETA